MDYKKVHSAFIEYCSITTPRERLLNRSKVDLRLAEAILYTESHHILPRSLGGEHNFENRVELLPEEHLFIHHLRFKAFNHRQDMLAFRLSLNGFSGREKFKEEKYNTLSKKTLSGYAWLRHNSSKFRKEHGWQTEDGIKRISESMLGKVIVKEALTGKLMGKHDRSHPKILSGEWTHHTKGLTHVINPKTGKRMWVEPKKADQYKTWEANTKGERNGRYSGVTRYGIIKKFLAYCTYIKYGARDPKVFSGADFNRFIKTKNKTFPTFPVCIKLFRFPELKNYKKGHLNFLIETFLPKEDQDYFKKIFRKKSDLQVNKMRDRLLKKGK